MGKKKMSRLKAQLRGYQRRGVNIVLKRFGGRGLLADDMGLGKTLQAIALIERVGGSSIICCPASLKFNWLDEFEKFLPDEKVYICHGRKPPKKIPCATVFICNYEILFYWEDFFCRNDFNTFVADEGHFLKNKDAKRTGSAVRISSFCRYRLVLTGTPIENKPAELFTQLKIIDPKIFPSWLLFVKRYNGAKRSRFGWQLSKATHSAELNKVLLDKVMVRRKKSEVLTELPEKVRRVIPIEIDNRKEYSSAFSDVLAWIKENTELDLDKARKAQAIIKMDKLKYIAAKGKVAQVANWINSESENRKLVVFCYHKSILASLSRQIENHLLISAETKIEDRQKITRLFQKNESSRVILTTIKIGGTGHTWTAADTTVFIQQDWNSAKHDQAEDRVCRIGQKSDSVNAVYFVGKATIEERLIRLIDEKRKIVGSVIDGVEIEGKELLTELLEELNQEEEE